MSIHVPVNLRCLEVVSSFLVLTLTHNSMRISMDIVIKMLCASKGISNLSPNLQENK
jgi:hypothetical protein